MEVPGEQLERLNAELDEALVSYFDLFTEYQTLHADLGNRLKNVCPSPPRRATQPNPDHQSPRGAGLVGARAITLRDGGWCEHALAAAVSCQHDRHRPLS